MNYQHKIEPYGALHMIGRSTLGGKVISDMIDTHTHLKHTGGGTGYAAGNDVIRFKVAMSILAAAAKTEEYIIKSSQRYFSEVQG